MFSHGSLSGRWERGLQDLGVAFPEQELRLCLRCSPSVARRDAQGFSPKAINTDALRMIIPMYTPTQSPSVSSPMRFRVKSNYKTRTQIYVPLW